MKTLNDLNKEELILFIQERGFYTREEPVKMSSPADVLVPLMKFRNKSQEHFLVMTLDGAHQLIKVHVVSVGLLNRSLVHPREVFRPAIKDNAAAVIVCHNHPSGNVQPSPEDDEVSKRLISAGDIIGIPVLDHVIITPEGKYFSYLEKDKL